MAPRTASQGARFICREAGVGACLRACCISWRASPLPSSRRRRRHPVVLACFASVWSSYLTVRSGFSLLATFGLGSLSARSRSMKAQADFSMFGARSASLVLHSLRNTVSHRETWQDENRCHLGKQTIPPASGEMRNCPDCPCKVGVGDSSPSTPTKETKARKARSDVLPDGLPGHFANPTPDSPRTLRPAEHTERPRFTTNRG